MRHREVPRLRRYALGLSAALLPLFSVASLRRSCVRTSCGCCRVSRRAHALSTRGASYRGLLRRSCCARRCAASAVGRLAVAATRRLQPQRTAGARVAPQWRAAALPLCLRAALSAQRAPTRPCRRTSRRIRRTRSTRRLRLRRPSGAALRRTALASPGEGAHARAWLAAVRAVLRSATRRWASRAPRRSRSTGSRTSTRWRNATMGCVCGAARHGGCCIVKALCGAGGGSGGVRATRANSSADSPRLWMPCPPRQSPAAYYYASGYGSAADLWVVYLEGSVRARTRPRAQHRPCGGVTDLHGSFLRRRCFAGGRRAVKVRCAARAWRRIA